MPLRRALIRLAHQKPHLRKHLLPILKRGGAREWDKMAFRLPWGDKRAESLMKRLQMAGYHPVSSSKLGLGRQFIDDVIFQVSRRDVGKFKGLMAYRISLDWQGFGPGALEGIEYMILSKGKRTGDKKIVFKGDYRIYGQYGETTVEIPKTEVFVKSVDPDAIRDAVEEEIQWYLEDNPELYSEVSDDYYEDDDDFLRTAMARRLPTRPVNKWPYKQLVNYGFDAMERVSLGEDNAAAARADEAMDRLKNRTIKRSELEDWAQMEVEWIGLNY